MKQEQQICLIRNASPEFMQMFDRWPPEARLMVRESKYNLCVACIEQYSLNYSCIPFPRIVQILEWAVSRKHGDEEVVYVLEFESKK